MSSIYIDYMGMREPCQDKLEVQHLSLLQLLQLSDSALPVGSLSHSLGLEALISDGDLEDDVETCPVALARYLEDLLSEWLLVDAVYCREAHACAIGGIQIRDLNQQISALRTAREAREASLTMGRRFAVLAAALQPEPALIELAKLEELHHAVAFGYTFGILSIDSDLTVGSFLHQTMLTAISAAQRLLPLGQTQANRIAWDLKHAILAVVQQSRSLSPSAVCCFAHLPDIACMRHPCLPTRLFVS
jgi:urease accessory protein